MEKNKHEKIMLSSGEIFLENLSINYFDFYQVLQFIHIYVIKKYAKKKNNKYNFFFYFSIIFI